jgi:hypothetical protein
MFTKTSMISNENAFHFMKFYLFWTDSLKIHLCEDCRNDEYEMNIA